MKFSEYDVPYSVYGDFSEFAAEGTYRTLPASTISGYIPNALWNKINTVTLMASASGQYSYYVANLHRVHLDDSAIDQQPLIIEFDHRDSATHAGFIDHGDWPGRTMPFGQDFADHISTSGTGAPSEISEMPSAEAGALNDLRSQSQHEAFRTAFSALQSHKKKTEAMNTSAEAIKVLEQALATTRKAEDTIENLIAEHDYQDVAALVTQAAAALLETAALLMQAQDEAALDMLENADDLIDSVYGIIEADLDEAE